jgi:trigger factor
LNIQIEHLENHTARLTVDVDAERLTKAMQQAARRIGQKVNIPGFRKGKAPYNIILKWVGEQAIMEEALDELGNQVYREALEESKLVPYAPGSLENVKTESGIQLTFMLSKQPEVTLGAYREVRLPFEATEVADDAVTEAIRRMQEQRALIESAQRPARLEDVVKAKIFGEVIHPEHAEAPEAEEAEQVETETAPAADEAKAEVSAEAAGESPAAEVAEAGEAAKTVDAVDAVETAETVEPAEAAPVAEDEDEDEHEPDVETFVDDEMDVLLTADQAHEFMPGFSANVVGLSAGEEKSFSLAFPADYQEQRYAGHTFNLRVAVQEVKSRILPEINDDFAKQVTDNEVDNLLDLRIRVRKDLQESADRTVLDKYADSMLDSIIKQAAVLYPDEMVKEFTTDILKTLDENLRQQGLSLNRLMQVQNKDEAALRADYREMAIERIKRTLVLGELLKQEQVSVTDEEMNSHLDTLTTQFSKDTNEAGNFRKMLNRPDTRRQIVVDLMMRHLNERLAAIGKGENPPLPEAVAESESAATTTPESSSPEVSAPESASAEIVVLESASPAADAPETDAPEAAAPAEPAEPVEPAEKTE